MRKTIMYFSTYTFSIIILVVIYNNILPNILTTRRQVSKWIKSNISGHHRSKCQTKVPLYWQEVPRPLKTSRCLCSNHVLLLSKHSMGYNSTIARVWRWLFYVRRFKLTAAHVVFIICGTWIDFEYKCIFSI